MKRKKMKKTLTKKTRYQIKTFIFDVAKEVKKAEQIDEPVNTFLKTANIKNEESILMEQGEGYVRISIIHKVKI